MTTATTTTTTETTTTTTTTYENFKNAGSRQCDCFRAKTVKIGVILAIFRLFEIVPPAWRDLRDHANHATGHDDIDAEIDFDVVVDVDRTLTCRPRHRLGRRRCRRRHGLVSTWADIA